MQPHQMRTRDFSGPEACDVHNLSAHVSRQFMDLARYRFWVNFLMPLELNVG